MNLEELVTDALAPEAADEQKQNTGIASVLHEETNSGALLHGGEELLGQMQTLEGSEFHGAAARLGALFLSFARSDYANPYSLPDQARSPRLVGAEIFGRAADYLHGGEGRDELLRFSRQAIDNHYLQHFFSDAAEHISFIEEIWGDETIERLARLGGVQKSTARNWMRGSHPASATHTLRRAVAVLYHLRSSLGIEGEAAREWMEKPLPGGSTPFEVICSQQQTIWNRRSGNVELDPLTVELEGMGISAFSWPATAQ